MSRFAARQPDLFAPPPAPREPEPDPIVWLTETLALLRGCQTHPWTLTEAMMKEGRAYYFGEHHGPEAKRLADAVQRESMRLHWADEGWPFTPTPIPAEPAAGD